MTRGNQPLAALKEAAVIAARRGDVRPVPGKRGDAFDLILFEKQRTIFIKVKRSVTQFIFPLEILHQYRREIAKLHSIPLTMVTAREFWVWHPNRTWQFFLIRHDSVVECRADGTYTPPAVLPMIIEEPLPEESSPDGESDSMSESGE